MSITQLALVRGGMSYVVRFRDGSFLVVDGGLDFNSWLRDASIKKREHYSLAENITLKV